MGKGRDKRKRENDKRRTEKASKMRTPGAKSNYARKSAYCTKHGVWGFDIRDKPWKKTA